MRVLLRRLFGLSSSAVEYQKKIASLEQENIYLRQTNHDLRIKYHSLLHGFHRKLTLIRDELKTEVTHPEALMREAKGIIEFLGHAITGDAKKMFYKDKENVFEWAEGSNESRNSNKA